MSGIETNGSYGNAQPQMANPFNDTVSAFTNPNVSGYNPSATIQDSILPNINAFTNNVDKLDGILNHINASSEYTTAAGSPVNAQSTTITQKLSAFNPFVANQEKNTATSEFPKGVPSMGKKKSLDGNKINYDALRETFDSDTLNLAFSPIVVNTQNQNNKVPEKPAISMDLFKDAAAAAFNELGSSRLRKHEFYNKISDVDFMRKGVANGKVN